MATQSGSKEIIEQLKNDSRARAEVLKMLARDHAAEYLAHVSIDQAKLKNVSPTVLISAKEWQD